jgi:hypothetical protein
VADKINNQGMFRKVRNLTNGKLSENLYEGFFTIYQGPQPEGEKEWFTATGNEHPSNHTWAALNKFTVLSAWRTDDEPHPPFWWPAKEGPALEVVGCSQS